MSIPFTWVYLIYDPYTHLFKLGRSDDPEARLKQLSSPSSYGTIPAAPVEYILLDAWLAPEELERKLHERFGFARVRGEWFDLHAAFEYEIGEGSEYLVQSQIEQILRNFTSLTTGYSPLHDECEMLERQLNRLKDTLRCSGQQLEEARLLGYTPKALLPAPVIDPTSEWPDVVAEQCSGALEAALVDVMQEMFSKPC